jgi:hypothetical protein
VASNSEWVIPAAFDSRRWFVLDVPSTKVGNFQYFGAIADEMENGGMEALLAYLQFFKLGSKESALIREAPVTEGLKKQRVLNAGNDTMLRWWANILLSGRFPLMDLNGPTMEGENKWPTQVDKQSLYVSYEQYCMDRHQHVDLPSPWAARMKNDFGLLPFRPRDGKGGRINAYKVAPLKTLVAKCEEKFPHFLDITPDTAEDEVEEG